VTRCSGRIVASLLSLAGCANGGLEVGDSSDESGVEPGGSRARGHSHYEAGLELPEAHAGCVELEVRTAREIELRELSYLSDTEAVTAFVAGPMVIGGAFGAAAAPLVLAYASYLLVGLPATAGSMWKIEETRAGRLQRAVSRVDFASRTRASLERWLSTPRSPDCPQDRARLELVIRAYGLGAGDRPEEFCTFGDAVVRVELPDRPAQSSGVRITPHGRSADAPPAYCTRAQRMLDEDAALAESSVRDLAEILGAVVASRIRVTP